MVEVEGTQTRLRCTLQYNSFEGGEMKFFLYSLGFVEVHETVAGVAVVVAGEETSWSK